MNKVTGIFLNHAILEKGPRYRITGQYPSFSWKVSALHSNAKQSAYQIKIAQNETVIWDSGVVESSVQETRYTGELPAECRLTVSVLVCDDLGEFGEPLEEDFYVEGLKNYSPGWISSDKEEHGKALYFRREMVADGEIAEACAYICGLGYHKLYVNGNRIPGIVMDPVHSDYTKTCYYTMIPDFNRYLKPGNNCIGVAVGEGWRHATGVLNIDPNLTDVHFFGKKQLSAVFVIRYKDGRKEIINTDEKWTWSYGPVEYNDIFNGETYNAGTDLGNWSEFGGGIGFTPAALVSSPGGAAKAAVLEPIAEKEIFYPRVINPINSEERVIDFGFNIAGVCRIKLPEKMPAGHRITIKHMEELDDDGSVYMAPARTAKQTDTYIASGDYRDLSLWQPEFTYHGFRYVQISGYPFISKDDICAVSMYNDIASESDFRCGNTLVNTIQENIVRTEKGNLHGLLTDCPQRDERQGWMNDSTVRYEETPYNFRISKIFSKITEDIKDTQGEDGSITCTAPHIFGCRPADPVCSSFLIAGLEAYLHSGNRDIISENYERYEKWEECLAKHTTDNIVTYSYYGDWAGPEYACDPPQFPVSAVTPGDYMSTGFYYYNAVLLERFAEILGYDDKKIYYRKKSEEIKASMLKKWWDANTGIICTGSQGCQSFALWLGILPEDKRSLAALRLHEDLIKNDYRITTGNLCTRYMFDVLTEYGYIEDAWKLITMEEYPSLGFMIQHEATTIWERFELKRDPAMNSHNHPMYGAVGYWFYAYLAGIKPVAAGFERVKIHPYFPEKLCSVNATVETPRGNITVRWVRRYGELSLFVTIPFGVTADIEFNGRTSTVGSGFHRFVKELD